ncbi:DNA ligase-1 [Nonlabens sp. Hel1_33_55]|uniref:ATP-dependent DNA ligase n=1 Tax=Nonlabens sp. Hel1_33_55 TaxID=1336802 RepID=UPI000875CE74|nr:ATP-dependent DNA ligase [Nonlabens sp. Hel1_33_55]SCY26799.1 DNA ligase-1 [Nonlabens sp. Hel1_33_55]
MKQFAELIRTIDGTNKTNLKVAALTEYFNTAPQEDKLWTIAILSHRRPKRPVNTTLMREWATDISGIPMWLFEESYHIVGDLAETIALILPTTSEPSDKSLSQIIHELIALRKKTDEEKKNYLQENWLKLNYYERFVFNKIMTGGFRIGVSQKLMTRALAASTGIDQDVLAHKLMGSWTGENTTFQELVFEDNEVAMRGKPYPFYLAYAVEGDVADLGDVSNWSAEHKWDGIRSQTIIRAGELFVWSRGEELVTDKYPEFQKFLDVIPNGTVIDGEILPYKDGEIMNFNDLQTRIGRKTVGKKLLADVPVVVVAYDLLEWQGKDIRDMAFIERRKLLEELVEAVKDGVPFNQYNDNPISSDSRDTDGESSKNSDSDKQILKQVQDDKEKVSPLGKSPQENGAVPLMLSETMHFNSWEEVAAERNKAEERRSEGLMLKKKDSPYLVGRKKGDWWKWKVDPFSVDAVLTYAMRGHGRRANLFTDYTFGLWQDGELVTFAKAYSGLTDAEFRKVDAWIKKNTLERFGPVRSVTPHHVFEIAFEGIAPSKRHKSGVATRFPRIVRWRQDKPIEEANTLDDLKALIPTDGEFL